jgi:Nif-specific regulatory protein
MSSVRLEVVRGNAPGATFAPSADVVTLGRAPTSTVVLEEPLVSGEHARLLLSGTGLVLEDLESTNGTSVIRGASRFLLGDPERRRITLLDGDIVELGGEDEGSIALKVALVEEQTHEHVVSLKPIRDITGQTASPERDREVLRTLYRVQVAIGATAELHEALDAVASAALELIPKGTHATIVLRSDDAPDSAFVPVATCVRQADGTVTRPSEPVPVTRSIVRAVARERAAVLATDAPSEAFSSESLLGANIRSTIGVPLWRADEILGVLQVDNRARGAMFDTLDLDALAALAANASLAVDNARLIRRLMAAEEQLHVENAYLKGRESARRFEIVGQSRALNEVIRQLDKVADTRVSVLIEGETGTGKELIASTLHQRSRRAKKLFVAQNCAALPETLLESELFGHKRGAFTGATEEKKGLFEIADGGTLFLDEVTEMPPQLQAKLLRVLQEGELRPVGATHTRTVNVRIVAATNRDLDKCVREGKFREDLYYRLKVFPIRLPPLRERRDDIVLLSRHFLDRYCRELGKPVAGFAEDTLELMKSHDWPGNVRELQNEVQRLVIEAEPDSLIVPDLLSARIRKLENVLAGAGPARGTLKEAVEQVERYLVLESLREHRNNKTNAAKALGITREGLHKKLRQLKIG